MNVYVSVKGKQIGPFDEDAVLAHLASGVFSVNDMAMRPGDAGWSRLGELFADRMPVSRHVSVPGSLQTPVPLYQQELDQRTDLAVTMRFITKVLSIVVMAFVILEIIIEMLSRLLPR